MGKDAGAGKNEWGEGGKARLSVDITTAMLVRIHYHGWFGFSTYSREILLGLTCFQHVYISAGLDSVHFQYTFISLDLDRIRTFSVWIH